MTNKYIEIGVADWDHAKSLQGHMTVLWAFRGQSDSSHMLSTSFERTCKKSGSKFEIEKDIINSFKSRAHHYLHYLPNHRKNLEWLAMLQHHGCPTRLLDFSKSFYIAAFFAIENATDECAVWAINLSKLHSQISKVPRCNDIPSDINSRRIYLVSIRKV